MRPSSIEKFYDSDGQLALRHYYEWFPPRLEMWYRHANRALGVPVGRRPINCDYAILPPALVEFVADLDQRKRYDFCFVGGARTDPYTRQNRKWIHKFIERHFNAQSYLQFTDDVTKRVHTELGPFDHTLERQGFVPKAASRKIRNWIDRNYYQIMAQSRFVLCPAGDCFWSIRFYEALMCRAIPIVATPDETFRSRAESKLDYHYLLAEGPLRFDEAAAERNHRLFRRYHTLSEAPAPRAGVRSASVAVPAPGRDPNEHPAAERASAGGAGR